MQRVVIVFVGILSVVRATPLDRNSVDQPTPFRYTFRVEKVEFSNDALKGHSDDKDDYEIGTFESDENSDFIDESDEDKSKEAVIDLFKDLQYCGLLDLQKPPKEGCAYAANGNVYYIRVLSAIDIEDVYLAFGEADIEECEVGVDGLEDEPIDGCFWINEVDGSVYWIGVYDEDVFYEGDEVDDIKEAFLDIGKCDLTADKIPVEGCALFDQDGIHYINVLNDLSVDDVETIVSNLNIPECIFDKEKGLTNGDPCYWINLELFSIHFLNLHGGSKGVHDDDYDDDSKKSYKIPTGNDNLQKLKLKGIFNQQSSVAKKAKAVLPKKIQSRKRPQEVQQKLVRRGIQHGRHGIDGGRVNHRPK